MNRDQAQAILTQRQFQVWDLKERGMGYKAISLELKISVSSVRSALHAAYLNLSRHTEAA